MGDSEQSRIYKTYRSYKNMLHPAHPVHPATKPTYRLPKHGALSALFAPKQDARAYSVHHE
jgi:hypothetical protein